MLLIRLLLLPVVWFLRGKNPEAMALVRKGRTSSFCLSCQSCRFRSITSSSFEDEKTSSQKKEKLAFIDSPVHTQTSFEGSALRSRKLRLSPQTQSFIICQSQAGISQLKRPRAMIGIK